MDVAVKKLSPYLLRSVNKASIILILHIAESPGKRQNFIPQRGILFSFRYQRTHELIQVFQPVRRHIFNFLQYCI